MEVIKLYSYTVTSEFAEHCKRLAATYRVSPCYEFVEWHQVETTNQILHPGMEWDTTEGEDHNEYKYYADNGASIINQSKYTLKQMLNGNVTHIVTWKFSEDEYLWNQRFWSADPKLEEGELIPYIIVGKTPTIDVLNQLQENNSERYVQLPEYIV
jgi:hypothetical protein